MHFYLLGSPQLIPGLTQSCSDGWCVFLSEGKLVEVCSGERAAFNVKPPIAKTKRDETVLKFSICR